MSEPVHTSETPATGDPESPFEPVAKVLLGAGELAEIAKVEQSSSWDDLFKGEDPAKVRQALADSRRWEQRAKENKAAADRLKEIEDRDLSELQKAQRDREELATRLASIEQEAIRNRIALAKGLPAEIAATLNGANEDELAAHADRLIAWRGNVPPATPRPDAGQGPRPSTPEAEMQAEYLKFFPDEAPKAR